MAAEVKTDQQVLKERSLEKAKEVMAMAITEAWDEVWKSKNRVVKAGAKSLSIGVSLMLDKIADDKLHVVSSPAWNEAHKGAKKSGEVSIHEDLFAPESETEVVAGPEDAEEEEEEFTDLTESE